MNTAGTILIVGGGIGGLTTAIALGRRGFSVEVIERDPTWSVYGVGIIQQANALRAMKELGIIDDYVAAGFGFNFVDIFLPNGAHAARVPSPGLLEGYPANLGIGRRKLHKVLGDRAKQSGAAIRLGLTVDRFYDDGTGVDVVFSDGTTGRYTMVIGADGIYSQTRKIIFPDALGPQFTGQAVWRYNLPLSEGLDSLHVYEGQTGVGLVPLSTELMYIYLTTPVAKGERYADDALAATMRSKVPTSAPALAALAEQITENDQVVYRPLEWLLLEDVWHKGRIVLLGDAVHTTTPQHAFRRAMELGRENCERHEIPFGDSFIPALLTRPEGVAEPTREELRHVTDFGREQIDHIGIGQGRHEAVGVGQFCETVEGLG